ncbi:nucleotidyl transferase AbiEii/AbiGii toxin family protein [Candidatus Woesearchaeota archaeon]|nr:nucleotidyl transferase AbiEii/AbiGii toxin family protein [Candidatus Woesearchaeota archaeon]
MNIEELRRIAAKEQLSLNYVAKDEMLSKVLIYLQENDKIILKGGTAINRVYLRNKRLSEDIDFDFISKKNVKESLIDTKEIMNKIKDFQIARPRIMKETIRYDLYYINPLNHKDKIRVEFKIVKKAENYEKRIVNFGFVPFTTSLINVYDVEELIKHKAAYIVNRLEGKDFFDFYFLLDLEHKKIGLDREKLLERLNLEERKIKELANTINHYIPRNERPNWILFLEELKDKIRNKIN